MERMILEIVSRTYVSALRHYNQEDFHLICLGDCEELWENTLLQVRNTTFFHLKQKRNLPCEMPLPKFSVITI